MFEVQKGYWSARLWKKKLRALQVSARGGELFCEDWGERVSMAVKTPSTTEVISKAESYDGIQAGIVSLKDVLKSPSYQAAPGGPNVRGGSNDVQNDRWPAWAQTVLVLALYHPEEVPRLDYWEYGDTWGNRRLRALLLENEFQATEALAGFSPCVNCKVYCQKACPRDAFPGGKYNRIICNDQMNVDLKNKVPCGEIGASGSRNLVIRYCRACEMSCPVGA